MTAADQRVSAMATCVELHITSYESKTIAGWVFNEHFKKNIEFMDICGMLNAMESLYDTLSFPQATFQPRHFGKNKKEKATITGTVSEMEEKDRATFVVHVQFRQNATWQGTIQWVDADKTQNFRSTLEMIRLIDEALDGGASMQVSWEN